MNNYITTDTAIVVTAFITTIYTDYIFYVVLTQQCKGLHYGRIPITNE